MAVAISNSINSFIRFSADSVDPCQLPLEYALPVYNEADINFQFIITGTQGEITALIQPAVAEIVVKLVSTCGGTVLFTFTEKPDRFSISPTQLLYTWEHGFPGFPGAIDNRECFLIQINIGLLTFCSNKFERITDPCFTSVLEFGNDEDAFGYKYCYGASPDDIAEISCEPTIIEFVNQATLSIPYTASLKAKYGNAPVIQTWIYDPNGVLTNMNIQATYDNYPPNVLNFNFGGNASGIIILR